MGRPAPIPRRSSHLGSAACHGRSDHGSHSSTSAASSKSNRRRGSQPIPNTQDVPGWTLRRLVMELCCKRCGSDEHVKNGLMRGQQRYLCKACGLNFTDTPPRGKPLALKVAAVLLYVSGLSMNRTAKLLGVSTPTVQVWLEQFAAAYAQKPEPEGRAVVIELDEMWHYLKKSPNRFGSGRLGIVLQASWWTGNAAVVTRPLASA